MSISEIGNTPDWRTIFILLAHLAGGLVLGMMYFRSLWWSVRCLTGQRRTIAAISLTLLRFGALAAALTLVSFEGAMPLLLVTAGIFIARAITGRQLTTAATS